MPARALTATAAAPPSPGAAPAVTPAAGGVLRRQCACGRHTAGGVACDDCARRKSPLRRKAAGTAPRDDVPAIADDVLRGGGLGFGGAARTFMETRFARDFSGVQLHTDGRAAQAAAAVDALAYTVGRHIVFGAGRYAPETPAGAALLAHELAHVAQNAAGGGAGSAAPLTIGAPGDAAEVEADRAAQRVMAGTGPVDVGRHGGPALQRLDSGQAAGLGIGLGVLGVAAGLGIAAAAGAFDKNDFTDDELRAYLQVLDGGKIEGKTDSDNKARALVRRWMTGQSPFALSAARKTLLIREMQDGRVSDDDRNGIVTLLENTADGEWAAVLAPDRIDVATLFADIGTGTHGERLTMQYVRRAGLHTGTHFDRFLDWYVGAGFEGDQRPLARKVALDVLAIPDMDFADATEFRNEVFKRLRTSEMMKQSQAAENGFDYPENLGADSGCADYQRPVGANKVNLANARVNKAARAYWTDARFDPQALYYFDMTDTGRHNAFKALTTLFEPQSSICNKTLIHCDYLVTVIQFRAFAEALGEKKFDALVRAGTIVMQLTWNGFAPPPWNVLAQRSPKAVAYRLDVRPRTRQDFAIGDQVVFSNHLAFDGLNMAQQSPWRLENAVLIDQDAAGEDLFQGHGSGEPEPERRLLVTMLNAYNGLAQPAVNMARAVDAGQPPQRMRSEFPWVTKTAGKWVVNDPNREAPRAGRQYDLAVANAASPETEPLLPGLRDPLDFSRFGMVTRPAESAPGKLYRPD